MPDYKNGKIYRLICDNTGLVYIGSTCQTLSRRLSRHLCDYNKGMRKSSARIIEGGNFKIFLIENYPCSSNEELHSRERFHQEQNECVNIRLAITTPEERKDCMKKNGDNYDRRMREKRYECVCGRTVNPRTQKRHEQTAYHKKHNPYVFENEI